MRKKILIVSLLAVCLLFSSLTVAFAADNFTLKHKTTGTELSAYDWMFDYDFFFELADKMDQYLVAYGDEWYEVEEINAKTEEGKSFTEAVNECAPVKDPVDELEVLSVSAINAKEVQIKFSKPVDESTVIGDNDELENITFTGIGTENIDYENPGDMTAKLSKDGKTLTITAANYFEGQYAVLVPVEVKDLDGNAIKPYTDVLTVKDRVRPTVEKVEYVDFQTAEVIFSEPIKDLGTVTTSDETELASTAIELGEDDIKTAIIDLSGENVELNKDYTVTILGAKDFAGNLITPNPTEITVKKVKADTVKPVVEAITVVNDKEFTVKFSEKLKKQTDDKYFDVTVSTNDDAPTFTITQDEDDPTLFYVTTTTSLAGEEGAAIARTITIKNYVDLSGNSGDDYSKVVTFVADKIAPKVVSTKVEKISGVEHLIITFDENVEPQTDVEIPGKVVIDYIEYDYTSEGIITTSSDNFKLYKPVNEKSKAVQLDLSSLEAGDYTVTLPEGLVKDLAENKNEEKTGVKFTRTSDVDVDKPELVKIEKAEDNNDNYFVSFTKKLDPKTALDKNNYVIEGVTVKNAIFTKNDNEGAIVRLTLEEGSVKLTGHRTVTIKNIKSADGVVMDTVTTVAEFTENVRPTVKSARLTAEDEITLTFSEKVKKEEEEGTNFEVFVGNETEARELAEDSGEELLEDDKTLVITLKEPLSAEDLQKDIVVKKAPTNGVKDLAGNKLSFTSIVVAK